MPNATCIECGHQWQSKVVTTEIRMCRACVKKSGQARGETGSIQETGVAYRANVEHIGVRELKANPGDLLTQLEESPDMEIIITRYGKASAKMTSVAGKSGEVPWGERVSLRGTWSDMPDLTDEDFAEAKGIWEPKIDA